MKYFLKGDIASASGSFLYLWNINGEKLASINTMPSTRNHVILSICMSQVNEWDQNNVIMTGGTDGVIRVNPIHHFFFHCLFSNNRVLIFQDVEFRLCTKPRSIP